MKFYHLLTKLSFVSAAIASFASVLLAFLIVYDSAMRFIFAHGSVALQELQWHLFDLVFLMGLAYTLHTDKHVRVDIIYQTLSKQNQKTITLFGYLFAVIPFSLLMTSESFAMALQSFQQAEISPDPGGLGARWIIKGVLAFSFALLTLQAIATSYAYALQIGKKRLLITLVLVVSVAFTLFAGWYFDIAYPVDPIILLVLTVATGLAVGVPVAFVFGAAALIFASIDTTIGLEVLQMLPYRTYGIMSNVTLMAVPLFIFMGLILERANVAKSLLGSMGRLFGSMRGGLAISTVVVGAILAAGTGIVGASVVMMGLIALPLMLQHRYNPALAAGTIVASGTLGQIIPPSVVLIILADQMHISVGDLFQASVVPGVMLVALYIVYIAVVARMRPQDAPAIKSSLPYSEVFKGAIKALIAPLLLIVAVLGSIFTGIASPSEAAAVGAVGAIVLAAIQKELSWDLIRYAAMQSVQLSSMIFMILIGATAFSLVFHSLGGGEIAHRFFAEGLGSASMFVVVAMVVIFVLGFFVDFIEIAFVVVPILAPIGASLGIDPIWFAILIALNLQTSFLTPPFGFALFYLKGVAKDTVSTWQIYKGVIPFIAIQLCVIVVVALFPSLLKL